MDDVGRSILWLFLAILLMLFAMLFSAANEAYDDAGVSRLRRAAEEDDDLWAQKLLKLQFSVQPYSLRLNLCGGVSLLLSICFLLLGVLGLTQVWWQVLLIMVIGGWILLFFGLCLPRVLAESDPTGFVHKCWKLLRFCAGLFYPLTALMLRLSTAFAENTDEPKEDDDRTEEEIRLLVDAGTDSGAIEASENEMIDNIFEFDDRTVGEVMTHRTDVCAVEEKAQLSEILELVQQEGVSRVPVYRGRIDTIIGVLYVKDLLQLLSDPQRAFCLEEFVRPVLYTPEQTMCNTLFREFQQKKVHFAVVVDEYGGTAGIVTMEDLLEAIVGNIQDEYDHEEDMIRASGTGSYLLSGDLEVDRAEKLLGITFEEAESADTLGGILINMLQRIPDDGEKPTITVDGWTLQVTRVKDQHIEEIQAKEIAEQSELAAEKGKRTS